MGNPWQWLVVVQETDYTILRWLSIDKESDESFSVAYFESFDEGNADFLDIYSFSSVDPDDPFVVIHVFNSIADVLSFAVELIAQGFTAVEIADKIFLSKRTVEGHCQIRWTRTKVKTRRSDPFCVSEKAAELNRTVKNSLCFRAAVCSTENRRLDYFEAGFQPLSRAVPSSPNLPFSPADSFPPKV